MVMPRRALVRPPGRSYADALTRLTPPPAVSLEAARSQHAAYAAALRQLGVEVVELPADDAHPDSVFVQDRVCVVGGRAILGRSAVQSRCGEEQPLVEILEQSLPVLALKPPAFLDWGDVLVTAETLFVGLSERSNAAAVEQLSALLAPSRKVEAVAVPPDLLHLLSGCSPLEEGLVLSIASLEDFWRGRGLRTLSVFAGEELCGNVLAIGGHVLAPVGYPRTCAAIERAGLKVHPVPVSEFEKRDGGVTCLSVLF
jgi:dimethylargininase